jgi:alcohol dehydrogenase class IV
MRAAMLAGLAFGAAGTAAAHAIQYPVGALTHTAHGLGVAVLLRYVMQFNRPACASSYAEIGQAMGVTAPDEASMADAAVSAISALLDEIGIPRTLADLGLKQDQVDWVAEQSLAAARLATNNPRTLDLDGSRSIARAAFAGARVSAPSSAVAQESIS